MDRLSGIKTLTDFAGVADEGAFTPLPDDWVVGVTDVVSSTAAVAAGKYKTVNMAGAAAISAVMNAIGTRKFAFAFGGDGCVFALPGADEAVAREALARTAAFVRDELGLELRVGLATAAALRSAGADVRAVLFAPSPHVAYAMFDGGGVALAEDWLKDGTITLDAAPPGSRPDLSGLSCRWLAMPAQRGTILSVIVKAGERGGFVEAQQALLALTGEGATHPVPDIGPAPALVVRGLALEARASRGDTPLWRRLPAVFLHGVMGFAFFTFKLKAGAFDAPVYRRLAGENADVRKVSDGLMLTLDCSEALAGEIEALLAQAAARGAVRYGLHRQPAALMTCIVPSYQDDGHFHFVDGADGGYTAAARALKV